METYYLCDNVKLAIQDASVFQLKHSIAFYKKGLNNKKLMQYESFSSNYTEALAALKAELASRIGEK